MLQVKILFEFFLLKNKMFQDIIKIHLIISVREYFNYSQFLFYCKFIMFGIF